MTNPKRKLVWDVLPEHKKQECLNKIIAFSEDSMDEKIGLIAAEEIYDLVMESTFDAIYNKGVTDAQKTMQEKIMDLNVDLESLIKTS